MNEKQQVFEIINGFKNYTLKMIFNSNNNNNSNSNNNNNNNLTKKYIKDNFNDNKKENKKNVI